MELSLINQITSCVSTAKRAYVLGYLINQYSARNRDIQKRSKDLGVTTSHVSSVLHHVLRPYGMVDAHVKSKRVCGKEREVFYWYISPDGENFGRDAGRYIIEKSIEHDFSIDTIFGNNVKFPQSSGFYRCMLMHTLRNSKSTYRTIDLEDKLIAVIRELDSQANPNIFDHLHSLSENGLITYDYVPKDREFSYIGTDKTSLLKNSLHKKVFASLTEPKSIAQISEEIGTHRTTVTMALSNLRKEGSVIVLEGYEGSRRSSIEISSAGKVFYDVVMRPLVTLDFPKGIMSQELISKYVQKLFKK